MAPFLVLGRKVRNAAGSPALELRADRAACVACGLCTKACPMSLDVRGMVQSEHMEDPECILCASCVDIYPKGAIRLAWGGEAPDRDPEPPKRILVRRRRGAPPPSR